MVLVWTLVWNLHGSGMVLVWCWYGFGMVLHGNGMGLVWKWHGFGMEMVWFGMEMVRFRG